MRPAGSTHLVVPEAGVAAEGARNIHVAEEGLLLANCRRVVGLQQFALYLGVVALVDDVVEAVTLRHHIHLEMARSKERRNDEVI